MGGNTIDCFWNLLSPDHVLFLNIFTKFSFFPSIFENHTILWLSEQGKKTVKKAKEILLLWFWFYCVAFVFLSCSCYYVEIVLLIPARSSMCHNLHGKVSCLFPSLLWFRNHRIIAVYICIQFYFILLSCCCIVLDVLLLFCFCCVVLLDVLLLKPCCIVVVLLLLLLYCCSCNNV